MSYWSWPESEYDTQMILFCSFFFVEPNKKVRIGEMKNCYVKKGRNTRTSSLLLGWRKTIRERRYFTDFDKKIGKNRNSLESIENAVNFVL